MGGGIRTRGMLQLRGTIIANSSGMDCYSDAIVTAEDHNLIENDGCGLVDGVNGDLIGYDPNLGPLALYGGRTKTHALLTGSPALEAGDNTNCPATDQRGKPRPANTTCDIGAFERQVADVDGVASPLSGETPVGSTGVSVTVTIGDPVTITVYKRLEWPGLGQTAGEFDILWTVMSWGESFTLDLKLCYTDAELTASGVANENTLHAYRWNEFTQAWEDKAGVVDAGAHCE